MTIALWRARGPRKWGNHVIGPMTVVVGLAATGFGSRLFPLL